MINADYVIFDLIRTVFTSQLLLHTIQTLMHIENTIPTKNAESAVLLR